MTKIELYIEGNKIDINDDIDFVLNKQFTDIEELTSIIVDYSKTISVPMTGNNNNIFNNIYNFNHTVLLGRDIFDYNPKKKMSMMILYNDSVVLEGYAVLSNVNYTAKVYEINLYGQLGKIFSTLKNKKLVDYEESQSGFFAKMNMNTNSIYKSYSNFNHSLEWSSPDWTDFYGFAPQVIGNTDLMDTKTFEVYDDSSVLEFKDIINERRGIEYGDIYVGDGLDFNSYMELRTYMNRPYVYVDKLVQLVQNELNDHEDEYDGYRFVLDDAWFNSDNPYYSKMCYFPGKETSVDKGKSVNGMVQYDNFLWPMVKFGTESYFIPDVDGSTISTPYIYKDNYSTAPELEKVGNIGVFEDENKPDCDIKIDFSNVSLLDELRGTKISSHKVDNWSFEISDYNKRYLPVRYIAVCDKNGNPMYKMCLIRDTEYLCLRQTGSNFFNWYKITDLFAKLKKIDNRYITNNGAITENYISGTQLESRKMIFNFGQVKLNSNIFRMEIRCDLLDTTTGSILDENIDYDEFYQNHKMRALIGPSSVSALDVFGSNIVGMNMSNSFCNYLELSSSNYRSGSTWGIRDILGDDFNPFKWMLEYVKRFRIYFDVDYSTKTIKMSPYYFDNIEFKDVIVDYSKDVVIEPLISTAKKINFGYKENNSIKSKGYKSKFALLYGEMDVNTGSEVSDETNILLKDLEESVNIPVSLSCLAWYNLSLNWPEKYYDWQPVSYRTTIPNSKIINTLDKDNKIEYYSFYKFRTTNDINRWAFYLTDDTPNMKLSGKYSYLDHRTRTEMDPDNIGALSPTWWEARQGVDDEGNDIPYIRMVRTVPCFENWIQDEDSVKWVSFGVPAEVYNDTVPSKQNISIYDSWKNFLNEIYSENNKKITCYVMMSYPEFINFKFNQLFVIDGSLFLVNKIIDFDPNTTDSTKVELFQIDNKDNLTTP